MTYNKEAVRRSLNTLEKRLNWNTEEVVRITRHSYSDQPSEAECHATISFRNEVERPVGLSLALEDTESKENKTDVAELTEGLGVEYLAEELMTHSYTYNQTQLTVSVSRIDDEAGEVKIRVVPDTETGTVFE